jgi:hypothetical protein
MSASLTDKQKFQQIVRASFGEAAKACVRNGHEMTLGRPSLNLIVASELIKLGSAFAIRLGANEGGVAHLARSCYNEAQALVRADPVG